ncbi:MAG: alanine racemase, partial [Alphaproteobacteria bacterium]|nr:alanine racemase [Alphaproteobacteria bacterium]
GRLAALARIAKIALCADDAIQVRAIEAAAEAARVRLPVLVEIDVGAGRCGLAPGPDAVALARLIAASPHLVFGGLQAYQGSAQHKRTPQERRSLIAVAVEGTRRTVEQLRQQGLTCAIVGGGGTGTFALEAGSGVYNEVQAGSYVFMDADYARNRLTGDEPFATFGHSLFVLSTVMSAARPGVAVLDAGLKAVAVDSGLPLVWQRPDIQYVSASDEHGKLAVASETASPKLGEKLRLVPGHCDPTVDRYDWYVCVRAGRVECVWPVAARGAMS